jgi:DNA-binding MarR family transcriptional regulator
MSDEVVIGGKTLTVDEAKEKYSEVTITSNPTAKVIIELLQDTDVPLTRKDLAEKAGKSSIYIGTITKSLEEAGYLASFTLGGSRRLYYALTPKGYDFSK